VNSNDASSVLIRLCFIKYVQNSDSILNKNSLQTDSGLQLDLEIA
jgi:hypothetical protein